MYYYNTGHYRIYYTIIIPQQLHVLVFNLFQLSQYCTDNWIGNWCWSLLATILITVVVISDQYCKKLTNDVISCDYSMILIIIEKCSFSNQKPEGRQNIGSVSIIGT